MKNPLTNMLSLKFATLFVLLLTSMVSHAQSYNKDEYSRVSLGANIGIPFFWGDLTSFSSEKTYIGIMGGLQAGYQVSPVVGFGLTADIGQGEVGTMDYSKGFFLGNNGIAYPCPPLPSTGITTKRYDEVYAKVKFFSAGLFADFNVNRMLWPSKNPKRLTALVGPAIYVQQYTPKVYAKATDNIFTGNSGKAHDLCFSVGANLTLRYNLSRTVDLQWRNSGLWVGDSKFEGVQCGSKENANFAWYSTVGVVFKLNGKGKKDNLMYARRSEPTPLPVIVEAPPKEEPKPVPEPPMEEPKPEPVVVQLIPQPAPEVKREEFEKLPELATVHFNRSSWAMDTVRYASELASILSEAKKHSDANIVIMGYTDVTGTDEVNKRIGELRVEAMQKYLVAHGIDAKRIRTGYTGVDKGIAKEKAHSEEARRVEVRLQQN